LSLAVTGDSSRSEALTEDLSRRFNEDTVVQFTYVGISETLDHRGIVLSDPIGALAHLQLGRAYALTGDKIKARSAYKDFLTLWKDADPDIPILKRAQSEYENLQ